MSWHFYSIWSSCRLPIKGKQRNYVCFFFLGLFVFHIKVKRKFKALDHFKHKKVPGKCQSISSFSNNCEDLLSENFMLIKSAAPNFTNNINTSMREIIQLRRKYQHSCFSQFALCIQDSNSTIYCWNTYIKSLYAWLLKTCCFKPCSIYNWRKF